MLPRLDMIKVFTQTDRYIQLLKENEQNIINSYQTILQNYTDLGIDIPNECVKSISKKEGTILSRTDNYIQHEKQLKNDFHLFNETV